MTDKDLIDILIDQTRTLAYFQAKLNRAPFEDDPILRKEKIDYCKQRLECIKIYFRKMINFIIHNKAMRLKLFSFLDQHDYVEMISYLVEKKNHNFYPMSARVEYDKYFILGEI